MQAKPGPRVGEDRRVGDVRRRKRDSESAAPQPLPRINPSVIVVEQDEESFYLVDTKGGLFFLVNATTARIFACCRNGASLEATVKALASTQPPQKTEGDILGEIQGVVSRLHELGLCEGETPRG